MSLIEEASGSLGSRIIRNGILLKHNGDQLKGFKIHSIVNLFGEEHADLHDLCE